eukprot:m.113014 g.113014  ORF g.113014 m.113014 type:complete len:838 (-) comp14116_c0_seq8:1501-4014(-)
MSDQKTLSAKEEGQQFALTKSSDVRQVTQPTPGDTRFLVSVDWWNTWIRYTEYDVRSNTIHGHGKEDQRNVPKSNLFVQNKTDQAQERPGPIDNSCLFDSEGLRQGLVDNYDFITLPKKAWDFLESIYGVLNCNHKVSRVAIPVVSTNPNSAIVEVYRMKLNTFERKSLVYKNVEASRGTTVRDVHNLIRKSHEIENEATRLWSVWRQIPVKILNEDHLLGDELGRATDIMIETKDKDGDWPTAAQDVRMSIFRNPTQLENKISNQPMSRVRHELAEGRSLHSPGVCGLRNMGNTCYMNSSLQCLSAIDKLKTYFLTGKFMEDLNVDNPNGHQGHLAFGFCDLLKELWSGTKRYITPSSLKEIVGKFAPQFQGFQQHDSQEFLSYFLDGLHEDLLRNKSESRKAVEESSNGRQKASTSIIEDLFHGQLKSTLICPDCHQESVTFDPFMYLSLPLRKAKERLFEFIFVPLSASSGISKFGINLTSFGDCSVAEFLKEASALVQVETARLKLFELIDNTTVRELHDYDFLRKVDTYTTIVYEVANPKDVFMLLSLRALSKTVGRDSETATRLRKPEVLGFHPFILCIHEDATFRDFQSSVENFIRGRVKDTNNVNVLPSYTMYYANHKPWQAPKAVSSEGFTLKNRKILIELQDRKDLNLLSFSTITDHTTTASSNDKNVTKKSTLTLEQCLDFFSEKEILGKNNGWLCPVCKEVREASKQLEIWKLPPVMIIQLKRFSFEGWAREKIETFVDFPQTLDMSPHVKDNQTSSDKHLQYKLQAVTHHMGYMGGGHYTSTAYNSKTDAWFNFDDQFVSRTTIDAAKVTWISRCVFFKLIFRL